MEKMFLIHNASDFDSYRIYQYLLLFDYVGIEAIKLRIADFHEFSNGLKETRFEELSQSGLVKFTNLDIVEDLNRPLSSEVLLDEIRDIRKDSLSNAIAFFSEKYDLTLSPDFFSRLIENTDRRTEVSKIVLKNLPHLSAETDIKRFIDFKRDPASKLKLAALRNWMTDITYTQYTQNEIEDKMEYLLMQYQDHMDRAKLKYTLGSAEFWITALPEIIYDLANFKLGSAAKALFGFAKKELMLVEEERKAPGKELAFVYKAQQEFGG